MGVIVSFVLGLIIGILATYSWQKGILKEAGIK